MIWVALADRHIDAARGHRKDLRVARRGAGGRVEDRGVIMAEMGAGAHLDRVRPDRRAVRHAAQRVGTSDGGVPG